MTVVVVRTHPLNVRIFAYHARATVTHGDTLDGHLTYAKQVDTSSPISYRQHNTFRSQAMAAACTTPWPTTSQE